MKRLLSLLALTAFAALPLQAGTTVHVSIGGYGGYHGYSAGCYGGHGYYGGGSYRGGYYGGYGYGGYGGYGYPIVSYGSYYGAPIDYGYSGGSYATTYAPSTYAPETQVPAAPEPAPTPAPTPAVSPTPSTLPVGSVDGAGFVHSPFTNTAFKVDTYANGQTFYDPVTGQPFTVHKTDGASKPAQASAAIPSGRIDNFGYVHSPYSTYFAKVRTEGSSQVYHDPNTGQFFTVIPKVTAQHVASVQIAD